MTVFRPVAGQTEGLVGEQLLGAGIDTGAHGNAENRVRPGQMEWAFQRGSPVDLLLQKTYQSTTPIVDSC